MDQDTQEKLEIKIAFLQRQIEQLNEIVLDQGKGLTRMEKRLKELYSLIEEGGELNQNTRPPHY